MMQPNHFRGLYAIVDDQAHAEFGIANLLQELVFNSAVTVLQLRLKTSSDSQKRAVIATAVEFKKHRAFTLILNDDVRFLDTPGLDGLHLGQSDGDFAAIRQAFPNSVLGLSTHSLAEAQQAQALGADYIGCGCLFPTATKTDTHVLAWAELQKITAAIHIPKVGIGGIHAGNMQQPMDAGCNMVAMISSLVDQKQFVGHTLHKALINRA